MRTTTRAEKTERICLPRRLVPRRPRSHVERMRAAISAEVSRFCVGDILTFETPDGHHHYVTVLGIQPSGAIDAMVYDGKPHLFPTSEHELAALRIVRVERMSLISIQQYRCLLKLEEWPQAA